MDNKDAFGQEMLKTYRKEYSFEVVERDDGYVNMSGYNALYLANHKNWEKHEKEAIKYAKGRCLDIGCGARRVALYLQKKGQYSLGIDTSPLAIKVCKLVGVKHAKVMGIDDINKFSKNSFDSIVLFGNNFGLFANKKKTKRLLKEMHRITSDSAAIIAESRDPYLTDNPVHFKYHDMNRKKGRMPGQLHIRIRFMQYATDWFDYLLVSKKEMKELVSGTGWKLSKFIDAQGHKKNGVYIGVIVKQGSKGK